MKNIFCTVIFLIIVPIFGFTQVSDKITWHSFEDAVKLTQEKPKKVFIDVYTEWCGWCKQLDKTTFKDPVISYLMNKYYYAVKLDAERKDTVMFNGKAFVNPNPNGIRSTHQLANAILNNQMSYPTSVFMTDSMQIITILPGYNTADQLAPILIYIGENKFMTMPYDSFHIHYKPIKKEDIEPVSVILNKVQFDAGKTDIKRSSFSQLDSVVNILKTNSTWTLEVDAYTDNTGNTASNKTISEARSKAVNDYLIKNGIEAARITYFGMGQDNPVTTNATPEGRAINRRIVVKFVK